MAGNSDRRAVLSTCRGQCLGKYSGNNQQSRRIKSIDYLHLLEYPENDKPAHEVNEKEKKGTITLMRGPKENGITDVP
eukprot:6178146-Pleurochrysis_carterae.AAC.8